MPLAPTFTPPSPDISSGGPPPINFEQFSTGAELINKASVSLSGGLTALSTVKFGVIKSGADTFGTEVTRFRNGVQIFGTNVNRFQDVLTNTSKLVQAMESLGNINGTITVNGSISVPDQISLNLEGLDIGTELVGFRQSILTQVGHMIQLNNPTIDIDDISGLA